jgi:hypothetical protein
MPRIPVAENQVRLGALPNVQRLNTPTGGIQAIGSALQDVSNVRFKIQQEEQQKADHAAVIDADRQLGQQENALLFDPENGAYTKQGKNAFGIGQTTLEEYDKNAAKIAEGLTSDRQKMIFKERLNERRTQVTRDLGRYEFDQREKSYDDTDEASLTTSVATAANYAGRPDRIAGELSTQKSVITSMARRKGWDQTKVDSVIRKAETQTHAAVVGRFLVDNKFSEAGRYLAAAAVRMEDPVVEQLQRQVILQEEQVEVRQARDLKKATEGVIKEGDKLLYGGQLTPQWIEKNRRVLGHEDYRYFLRKLNDPDGESSAPRDARLYSDLRERSGGGEDVKVEAREALIRGQIRSSDYDRILGEVEGQRPGWYKRGSQFIATSAAVSDLNPDPAAAQRKAQMLDDWDTWVLENPKASETEAQTSYKRIVDEYAIINTNQMTLTKRAPQFLKGSRNQPDLDTTESETVKAFEDGQIDRKEFERQAALIAEWRQAFAHQQAAKPAAKK